MTDTAWRLSRPVRASPTLRAGADHLIVIPALAIGFSIVAGMAFNVTPLATAGALAAIIAALVAPAIGLATLVFMGPLQPPLVLPAPGFNALLVGAIVLGCVYRLPIDRPRIRLTAPFLLLLGFVLYVGVQQLPDLMAGYAGVQGHLVGYLFVQLLIGFGAVVAAGYLLHQRSPFPFLAVGLVSAVLVAVMAIVTINDPAVGPPLAGLMGRTANVDRPVGSFGNPNYFATFGATATITALGWMLGARSSRLRVALLAASIVLGVGMAVALSRGGVIAFAAGLVCLVAARSRRRNAAVLAGGLVVATLVLFPLFVEWRLTAEAGSASGSAYASLAQSDAGRLGATLAGPQIFLSSPLFGVGWGYYSTMSAQFVGAPLVAHNWYVSVLAEEGTVGIVLWILLLATLTIALRSRPRFPRSTGFGVLGAYAVGCLFLEAPQSFQTSVLAILVIVAALNSDWGAQSRGPDDGGSAVIRQGLP